MHGNTHDYTEPLGFVKELGWDEMISFFCFCFCGHVSEMSICMGCILSVVRMGVRLLRVEYQDADRLVLHHSFDHSLSLAPRHRPYTLEGH